MKEKKGLLLVNLGTPEKPKAGAIRRYLREFLSDKRVVELPRAIWLPLLYLVILPFRPKRLAPQYREIWTDQGSPLLAITQAQAAALQQAYGNEMTVACAMRYGSPSIADEMQKLLDGGCESVTVLPMYPQYSSTTTATVIDALSAWTAKTRVCPSISIIRDYHDHPAYISALAKSIRSHEKWEESPHLMLSFHGIPKRNIELGDIYEAHCQATAKLLAEQLGLSPDQFTLSFQSRLGRAEWLQPYTEATLRSFPDKGIKNVLVACPGFPADCLETLEEIAITNRDVFLQAGGESFHYVSALNAGETHIEALKEITS